jgi:thiaminase/transcriptional activator TenA
MSVSYSKVVSELISTHTDIWSLYTKHSFLEQLANGSLPNAQFLKYLKQDYIFLIHFSRAWALATAKSDSLDEMVITSSIMHSLINEEMALHIRVCEREGINIKDLKSTIETPENLAYTRYVLEAGYSGDFLDLLISLSPCILGYGEIGIRLKNISTSQKYKEWIDTYSSPEYQNVCCKVGKLIDDAVLRRIGNDYHQIGKWKILNQYFAKATLLEIEFWEMGLKP